MGENKEGKLGLGKSNEYGTTISNPMMIDTKGFEHTVFVACSAGEAHTCLIDKDGVAYATGYGEGGRLGNSTCRSQHTFLPMLFRRRNRFALSLDENILSLSTKNPPRIFAVECGRCWTLLLTLDGIPYGTGRNVNGQMGYSYCADDELPTNLKGIGRHQGQSCWIFRSERPRTQRTCLTCLPCASLFVLATFKIDRFLSTTTINYGLPPIKARAIMQV